MGIHAILVINNHGQPRLVRYYNNNMDLSTNQPYTTNKRQSIINEIYQLISKRNDNICNFLENTQSFPPHIKLIYRHYATLYFIFVVDQCESELGILDLIQVYVECLDKCFENVCELDLIFHVDKCYGILDEIIQSGAVVETSLKEIIKSYHSQIKYSRDTELIQHNVKQIGRNK